ncbi:FkbM family methyltransferase [Pendulispora rubella]|uniref:FkbM family methyltransferase n=1 Tax=Pendulispora rubella TaxID=2741070 RepID=A0ABZ2L992_9BACT
MTLSNSIVTAPSTQVAQVPQVPLAAAETTPRLPVALMFPGLGDHYLDMGLELYRTQPIFQKNVDLCAELLKPELGVDIRDIIYPNRASSPAPVAPAAPSKGIDLRKMLGRDKSANAEEKNAPIHRTCYTQPALFVVEYALASLWRSWGLRPDAMIGYSLGEYVAACLAGVLSLQDSLTLVARRAALIESLPPGAMLAISLPEIQVLPLLGTHLSLSAINAPELSVVAGPPEEVEALERRLATDGVASRRVKSSHAFHSRMMEPIAEQVTQLAKGYTLKAPRIPYVSNVTGAFITEAEATDPSYFARHLCQPVRFFEGISQLLDGAERILLESGPGQTLSSMVTQHAQTRAKKPVVIASMRHSYDPQSDVAVLHKAVSRLWQGAASLDWDQVPQSALAANDTGPRPEAAAPSDTEDKLGAIWKKTLNLETLDRDVSFFDLGGNSLVATRLIFRISRVFSVKISLRRLYEVPTLADMAKAIDALKSGSEPAKATKPAPSQPGKSALKPRLQLPNGLHVTHQNEAETRHFYSDIFDHRTYAKNGVTIEPGACVFDVGSNIGLFTLFAHTETKGNIRIFAFDPAPPIFEILSRNVAEHGINATLVNCGISNRNAEAQFTFYPRSAGMSSFHPDVAEEKHVLRSIMRNQRQVGMADVVDQVADYTEELLDARFEAVPFTAKLRRLSDVIREYGVEKIDLLKVDVQKCELEVLEGIDDADWSKIRQVVLEAHDVDDRVHTIETLLRRHGFSVKTEHDEMYEGTNIHNIYGVRA